MKVKQIEISAEQLRQLQLIQTDILVEFDRVCRENNIRYILDAGTLLGAIRHKGFIPWDDDIDVRMLRSDYEKFREIADDKLSGGVYFQDHINDKYYPWIYSKVRLEGTKAVRLGQEKIPMKDGIFIDIFPCDGVPEDAREFKTKCRTAHMCRRILYARTARFMCSNPFLWIKWNVMNLIPKSFVYAQIDKLAAKYTEYNCSKVGCLGWHAPKDVNGFDIRWFTELTEVEFEGRKFLAPKDYDGFLRFSFGDDYMTPPPESDRATTAPLSCLELGK